MNKSTFFLAIAFSPTSERLLAEAVVLIAQFTARLALIHVGDPLDVEDKKLETLLSQQH